MYFEYIAIGMPQGTKNYANKVNWDDSTVPLPHSISLYISIAADRVSFDLVIQMPYNMIITEAQLKSLIFKLNAPFSLQSTAQTILQYTANLAHFKGYY